jgi:hypothetical protein
MTKQKKILLIVELIAFAAIFSIIAIEKNTGILQNSNSLILVLFVGVSVIAALRPLKKRNNSKKGIPSDDELSLKIKYKSGYYAYFATIIIWLIIFLLKDSFPNTETILISGILLSTLSALFAKTIIRKTPNEEQD